MRSTLMSAMAAMMSNFDSILHDPLPLVSTGPSKGDFRRQALKPSKWRQYRDRNIEKNRASLKAMGLSSNVFEWPIDQQPEWAVAKLHRNRTPGVIDPEINRTYRDY